MYTYGDSSHEDNTKNLSKRQREEIRLFAQISAEAMVSTAKKMKKDC